MKVYINHSSQHARDGAPEHKVKTTLPASWLQGPIEKVIGLFCKQYNAKFPDHALDPAAMLLANKNDVVLPSDGKVSDHISEYNDVFVIHKPEAKPTEQEQAPPGSVQCKNLGCGKWYLESENHDEACHYHTGAPVFHDLVKYWSCCPKKKALDWEEFQALPTCTVGRCCSEATVELFKPSAAQTETVAPMTEAEIKQMEAPPPPPAPVVAEDKPGPIVDGKARCRNKGCTVDWFVVADNHPEACHYHVGGPVFHDTAKYWSCCSHKKCFDWDDFMKVPTCTVGPHKV